jgi:hypothetical protein
MLVAIIPVVVALLGLVLWAISANPKVSQIGYVLFAVGVFFTVWALLGRTVKLL